MSNETDLDWLARNEHEWPTETDFVFVGTGISHGNMGWYPADYCFPKSSLVTKQQWLTRLAELQNKPSFADHPDAKCLFQHESGRWFKNIESSDMGVDGIGWRNNQLSRRVDCGWVVICQGEVLGDWRDTLEKRPEGFKQFVSIEGNQEQVMTQQQDIKQDNGWYERGELPPVGNECEALWNEGRMEYLRTKVFGVNEHGQPIHRFDEGPNKFEYQADPLVTILGTRVFRPIRTERDVLIEIIKKTDDTDDKIADAILAAGFSLRGK